MSLGRRFSNFIFGSSCLGCGFFTEKLDPWLCPKCREELLSLGKEPFFPQEDVVCLYTMNGLTRRLVHALKYHHMPGLASYLVKQSGACRGGDVCQWFCSFKKPFLLIPVPLHPSRLRERGYNQTDKIAYALASQIQGKIFNGLTRRSFSESQTRLSVRERHCNVAGAFQIKKIFLQENPTCIIVDDVYTTGATTSACSYAISEKKEVDIKVCTLLFEKPVSAALDFVADSAVEWD